MQNKPNGPSFVSALEVYRENINAGILNYFEAEASHFEINLDEREQHCFELLKDFCTRPGKRFRGALTLFSYEYFSKNKNNPSSIYAGIAVELVQNYLLIVDDVMDKSLTRRGKPTLHKLLESEKGLDEHTAGMLAINVGLLAAHMANHCLSLVDEDSQNVKAALAILNKNVGTTVYGQIDDLYNTAIHSDEPQIMRLYEMKNSYYTFINPLQIGAVLAGQSGQQTLEELAAIGRPAGIAFQLQDDLLGMFGDEEVTGKSSSDDLREGKFTLLILQALNLANAADKNKILKALGNQAVQPDEVQAIKKIIEACGARQAVAAKAEKYSKETKQLLEKSQILDKQAKNFLSSAVEYVTNRKV